jgi:hypothetical protein
MPAYKTTMFYEIQINKLLENIEGLSKEEIKERLNYMVSDLNKVS